MTNQKILVNYVVPGPLTVFYSLTHWDALNIYLQDGRLEIDNNKSERSIKPFVIGRKNWLCVSRRRTHENALKAA